MMKVETCGRKYPTITTAFFFVFFLVSFSSKGERKVAEKQEDKSGAKLVNQ